ncbi:MAG: aminoglycoside phosphotransferase family protein [Chloroflexia bacterium]
MTTPAAMPGVEMPFAVESAVFEGEGDFCRAYTVNGDWIFRFAYNEEGSIAMQREIGLLPKLAPVVSLPIPEIVYSGQQDNGLYYVGYRKIEGVPLSRDFYQGLSAEEQENCAREIALFLRSLHWFDLVEAQGPGVPESDYAFCRTEDGIQQGRAADIYASEGDRIAKHPLLDQYLDSQVASALRMYVGVLVKSLLNETQLGELPPVLVHGDLSGEHILFDVEARRIAGIIDFSDAIITTPLLDFAYLWGVYGPEFSALLFKHYEVDAPHLIIYRVRLLHQWHTALRLLWALDHDYPQGIHRWSSALMYQSI